MGTVNYSQLMESAEEPESFAPLPPGVYDVRVESVEVKQTKTGKVMFAQTLVVTSGEYAKRWLWNNMVVSPESPKAMGFFFRDMALLGATKEFFSTDPDEPAVAAKIIGAEAKVRVDLQKNDPTRNEVKGFAPAGQAAVASASAPASAPAAPPSSPF